jgi:GNAT superfamily N-acetyltransferase
MEYRKILPSDDEKVREFVCSQWGSEQMVVHDTTFCLSNLPGFLLMEKGNITALLTYSVAGDDCEIVSLDSLIENRGAASYLIGMLEQEQKAQHRKRIVVSTTNDNLHALKFYQKRGFDMVCLRYGAVDRARKKKPQIPLKAENKIPIRHEIELEKML